MDPGKLLLFATGGLADAAYLFIVAAGLSLVFGALRVINMAHGSLYMIAALVSVVVANRLGAGLGFVPSLIAAVGVAAAVIGVGMYGMLFRTRLGRNIRAAVSDPELLNASGVNVTLLYTTVFVIGAGLAGLGGAIVAPSQAVDPTIGDSVLVLAFAISVIGGLGSIIGSAVGALMVGEVISFGLITPATNSFALAFVFIVMTLVLTVRPWGLFGRAEA